MWTNRANHYAHLSKAAFVCRHFHFDWLFFSITLSVSHSNTRYSILLHRLCLSFSLAFYLRLYYESNRLTLHCVFVATGINAQEWFSKVQTGFIIYLNLNENVALHGESNYLFFVTVRDSRVSIQRMQKIDREIRCIVWYD